MTSHSHTSRGCAGSYCRVQCQASDGWSNVRTECRKLCGRHWVPAPGRSSDWLAFEFSRSLPVPTSWTVPPGIDNRSATPGGPEEKDE